MKKMAFITGVLACVMVILAALGSMLTAVWQIAIDETFYGEKSRAAVKTAMGYTTEEEVSAYIGLTPEKQKFFAETAREYMLGEDQSIDLPVYVSKDEVRHMLDVRRLVWRARDLSKACLTMAAALAMVIAWMGAGIKRHWLPKLAGSLSALLLLGVIGGSVYLAVQGGQFASLFVRMHELLFSNDLWLMDPARHILIRMMPQLLFEQALAVGAMQALRMFLCTWAMLMAIDWIVGGMVRRHMEKG